MKRWSMPLAVILLASQTACYTTKVVTGLEPDSRAYVRTDRQWFTLGGLVPLSEPAGRECAYGLSSAQSELGGVDILINVGLVVGGALLGSATCNGDDDAARASCAVSVATLVPFMLGTRTVEYFCAAAPAPNWAPTAPGRAPPPPPAPQAAPPPPPSPLSEPPPPPPSP
jgi:hypothetical protein